MRTEKYRKLLARALRQRDHEIEFASQLVRDRVGDRRVDDVDIKITETDIVLEIECEWETLTREVPRGNDWKIETAIERRARKYIKEYKELLLEQARRR